MQVIRHTSRFFATLILSSVWLSAQEQPADQHLNGKIQKQQQEIEALRKELSEIKAMLLNLQPSASAKKEPPATAPAPTPAAVVATKPVATSDTATAAATEKRLGEIEKVLKRFRWSGDVRVRGESFFQDLTESRHRARLRVRAGFQSTLGEDFTGGVFLASGGINDDPVSTNQTLTGFFTRKNFGLDRGWLTYQPKKHTWLQLTGGKWAYTWLRTGMTMDVDLNPEGFSEKLSFDVKHPVFKNVSVTSMQMMFNEVAGGHDSFAVGGQVSTAMQLGDRVKMTVAGTALNWQNADPTARATAAAILNANRNSNATIVVPGGLSYRSKFLYVDTIVETHVKTNWEKWPVRLTLDYVTNPRAFDTQNDGFFGEIAFGRQQDINDLQFGYSFARVERDAVIAAFAESDMRAQTNVLQNKIFALWLLRPNTTASFTGWFGRTLDRTLQGAQLPPGLPPGDKDPLLKRLQFDMIYRF
jgi:hypothetical protein